MRCSPLVMCAVSIGLAASGVHDAYAEKIRLKDGTEFSGVLLRKDPEAVTVVLPRTDVVAINGKAVPPPIGKGSPAPAFDAVDLSGATQTVPDSQHDVVVLQFWATWCPHCRNDVAMLTDLSKQYGPQGLRVVTVSVDRDMKALRDFVKTRPIPYPVIPAYDQPATATAELPDRYEAEGIPAYYIIDRKGVITQRYAGSLTESKTDLQSVLKPVVAADESGGAAK